MKFYLALILTLFLNPTLVFADSFNCDSSPVEHLHVRVQNNVEASQGTRTAAILLVTDNEATFGSRTLVSVKKITQNGAFWTVDTSLSPSGTPGQKLGNFERNEVSKVQLYLPTFDYNEANKDGEEYTGHLFLFKSDDTETFSQDVLLTCVYNTKS
jgi:hypothetical protein